MLRLCWVPVRRFAPGPLLLLGLVLGHGALVTALAEPQTPRWLICRFRALTGLPCPACGTGRAGLALLRGDPLAALAHNPLMVLLGLAALALLGARLLARRAPRLEGSPRALRLALLVAVGLLLTNWAWVLAGAG